MGLLSRTVESVLGGDGGEESFRYRCMQCGEVFEFPKTRMVGVKCPDCGSMDVRIAD